MNDNTPAPKGPTNQQRMMQFIFGLVAFIAIISAITHKPSALSMPTKPYAAPAGYSDITSAPALVNKSPSRQEASPEKDTRMTPQQAARVYGFAHCNLEGSAKGLGMSERELAAFLIAGIKVGIKPC